MKGESGNCVLTILETESIFAAMSTNADLIISRIYLHKYSLKTYSMNKSYVLLISKILQSAVDFICVKYPIFIPNINPTLSEKRFLNGSPEWSTVLPGTFCYLNQAKGSPNYTQLWRTIKGSSFSCEEP